MQTWTEIQDHFRKKYSLERDTPDMLSMVWMYEDGRSQKVILRRYSSFGNEMLEVKSPFAHRDEIDPEILMRKNSELPLATTALAGDVYLVVYNMVLMGSVTEVLEMVVSRIAAIADALESEFSTADRF